jgi:hypothetical protein
MECGCSGAVQMASYIYMYLRAGDVAEFVILPTLRREFVTNSAI